MFIYNQVLLISLVFGTIRSCLFNLIYCGIYLFGSQWYPFHHTASIAFSVVLYFIWNNFLLILMTHSSKNYSGSIIPYTALLCCVAIINHCKTLLPSLLFFFDFIFPMLYDFYIFWDFKIQLSKYISAFLIICTVIS